MSSHSESENKPFRTVDTVVIRFAGDSGDGMQLTGDRFTSEAAMFGNDLRTFPDYPAEIRAPAGTVAGVSAFQVRFSSEDIHTPGDSLDVLVAMNPAALKTSVNDLHRNGIIIANTAQFTKRNLEKAGYTSNPLEDGSLDGYKLYRIDIGKLTDEALKDMGLNSRTVERCKNFFALGVLFWMYHRGIDNTVEWLEKKFAKKPELAEANVRALKAGYFFGDTAEILDQRFNVKPATIAPGTYRNINGNRAAAIGLIAAAKQAGLGLFLGTYPITPASDILHELALHKNFDVFTFQAEDEIAGITSAIGAAFGGALAVTTTSGPGVALKGEAMGLAIMTELPLVIINVQRGGPSTGLPTKTEQSDLMQAMYGRNGEAPMPILAATTPADCFDMAYEAARIALKYMTPVMLLTDGSLANGTEPWRIPAVADLKPITTNEVDTSEGAENFNAYARDPETLSRPWARLGTPGLEHRIGGLEKEHITGAVCYDGVNHEFMCRLRAEKVQRIAQEIPKTEVLGDAEGDLLLVGWGSTGGVIRTAVERLRAEGKSVSAIQLRYVNPLPPDLADVMKRFKTVACVEMNLGQLVMMLRAETLIDIKPINKIQGQPFRTEELLEKAVDLLEGKPTTPFVAETLEHLSGDASAAAKGTESAAVFARLQ